MAITVDPNEPFHVLLGEQVTPVSLEVLDALYQDDTIQETTLIWQQGLGQWLRLDVVLAELEKQEPVAAQQREVEPDAYYVSFGDNDVRLLSLEQLDKFYDLEVIDDATLVWQPGFVEWIPLAVLIGEADAPPVSIHPSLGPQHAMQGQHATQRPPSMAPLASAPVLRPSSLPAPRPSSPVPASLGFEAPVPQGFGFSAAPASRPPVSAAPSPSVRPLSLAPNSTQGFSLAPNSTQALTFTAPPAPAKASPWFGRGLMAACFFVGLLVVQRNGVMMQLAQGAGQEQSWRQVEASVGGTSLDTPQGLTVWLSDLSTRHGLASLTPTEPIAPPPEAAASEAAAFEAGPSDAGPSDASASAARPAFKITPLPPAAPSTNQPGVTAAVAPPGDDVAEKMRAKLAGQAERAPVVARPASRPTKTSAKKKKSSAADAYDPMNGTL